MHTVVHHNTRRDRTPSLWFMNTLPVELRQPDIELGLHFSGC